MNSMLDYDDPYSKGDVRKGALRVADGRELGRCVEPCRNAFGESAPISGPQFHQQTRQQSQGDPRMEKHATQNSRGCSRRRYRQAAGTNFRAIYGWDWVVPGSLETLTLSLLVLK